MPSRRKKVPKARSQGRKAAKPAPARRRRKSGVKSGRILLFFRQFIYWGTVAGLWLVLGFAGLLVYFAIGLPNPENLQIPQRAPSMVIVDRGGAEIARRGAYRGNALRIEEMPPHLLHAVIATEDKRFYSHFGVDPLGLLRAVFVNLGAGYIVQGGSTISQQLAKNLFLEPERTFKRKIREFLLAIWLERKLGKNQIMELYLNRVYLGAGTYGVDAAALRYFGKSARFISLGEAATLAGLLKAPSRYAPSRNPKLSRKRMAVVLGKMQREGYISRTEQALALKHQGKPVARRYGSTGAGYAVDWVAALVPEYAGVPAEDIIVETTLDKKLQELAQDAVKSWMKNKGKRANASQAALIAMDGSGAIRALVGGVDYRASQFNRAVKARRQPGSAFKPFVYLAALESGLGPKSIRIDRPMVINGWMPRNYSGKYSGRQSLQSALAGSINTIAAGLTREVGVKKVISAARRLGISSKLHENPSIALGTSEVSLLELTGAYTPFMNGGYGVIPQIITRIRTKRGRVLFERSGSGPGRIINHSHVAAMNKMLRAAISSGTGKNARMQRMIAGKTGTSQGFRDAWFIGYSADLSTGVWVGNDDGSSMRRVTGGGLPARIWKKFMTAAHQNLPDRPLPGLGKNSSGLLVAARSKTDLPPDRAASRPGGFLIDAGFLKRLFSGSGRPENARRENQ